MNKFTKIAFYITGLSATNAIAIPLICNSNKVIETQVEKPLKPIVFKWVPPVNSKGIDKKAVETVNRYEKYVSCLDKGRLEKTCKKLINFP